MLIDIDEAVAILQAKLTGLFISRFSVGDTWDLYFGDCWLVDQNIVTPDEDALSQFFATKTNWYASAVDKEYISKGAFVTACMRKQVQAVTLDAACRLSIRFEDGSELLIPTNADIVDWQWGLNESGADPYSDFLVACFWAGEVEVPGSECASA